MVISAFTCHAILFDLDGVLVDSTASVSRVWGRWARERNLEPQTVIDTAHGRRSIETLRLVAPQIDAAAENIRVEAMEIADQEGVIALPGAADLLRRLPPERFAIVTSATRALASARLKHAGITVPANVVAADDVVNGKPHAEPYLKGAALLRIAPANCIVFEDTPSGIAAARAAGMRAIGLRTTYSADKLTEAVGVVGSLAEVGVTGEGELLRINLDEKR